MHGTILGSFIACLIQDLKASFLLPTFSHTVDVPIKGNVYCEEIVHFSFKL